jgi:hypothetical protein
MLSTDSNNQSRIIGLYGDDDNNLAPISGNLLRDSTSTLVAIIIAARYNLPALEADPLNLDAPEEAEADRFHYIFEDPAYAPSIALIPIAFPVPRGIEPPIGWDLSSGAEMTEALEGLGLKQRPTSSTTKPTSPSTSTSPSSISKT